MKCRKCGSPDNLILRERRRNTYWCRDCYTAVRQNYIFELIKPQVPQGWLEMELESRKRIVAKYGVKFKELV